MEQVKVVLRYTEGTVLKGYTRDFFPNKPLFHFSEAAAAMSGEGKEVFVKDLKAIFFVKDFLGNAPYHERKQFTEDEKPHGRKVEVTFRDQEVIVGTTVGYDPKRQGFFLYPVDPQSNNLRVFVVTAAVSSFRYL